MVSTGREWDWMDDDIDGCRIHDAIDQSFLDEEEDNLIEDDKWDHYSGLPNPKWYEE